MAKVSIGGDNKVGGDQVVGGNLDKTVEKKSNILAAVAFVIVAIGLAGAAGVAIKFRGFGIDTETQQVSPGEDK